MIMVDVTGRNVRCTNTEALTESSLGVFVYFAFDETWDDVDKTAMFKCGKNEYSEELDESLVLSLPEDLLSAGDVLYVSVYGSSGNDIKIPTIWRSIGTVRKGASL